MNPTVPTPNDSNPNPESPKPFVDRSQLGAAYQRRLAEILAVTDAELLPVNVDVTASTATVLGAIKKIAPYRTKIATLPDVNQHLVDGLEDYALAAEEADAHHTIASTPREDIVALNDEASKLREVVRVDTLALAKRGLVDPNSLSSFKGTIGYKNVARELIAYAALLGDNWPAIQGKTGMQEEELQHIKELGERLMRAAGEREQSPLIVAEAARIRQRAMTRFLQAYDEVRRALTFLRWKDDDVESIAPSLYAGRGGRGKPGTDDALDGALPAGTPEAVSTPAASPAHAAGATPATAAIPVGMPGSSPFIR